MDQIWTFNLVYTYDIRYVSFCYTHLTYNVFSFYGADLKDRLGQRWSNSFTEILNSGWYKGTFEVSNIGVGGMYVCMYVYICMFICMYVCMQYRVV
jgi:hypothetical protein